MKKDELERERDAQLRAFPAFELEIREHYDTLIGQEERKMKHEWTAEEKERWAAMIKELAATAQDDEVEDEEHPYDRTEDSCNWNTGW